MIQVTGWCWPGAGGNGGKGGAGGAAFSINFTAGDGGAGGGRGPVATAARAVLAAPPLALTSPQAMAVREVAGACRQSSNLRQPLPPTGLSRRATYDRMSRAWTACRQSSNLRQPLPPTGLSRRATYDRMSRAWTACARTTHPGHRTRWGGVPAMPRSSSGGVHRPRSARTTHPGHRTRWGGVPAMPRSSSGGVHRPRSARRSDLRSVPGFDGRLVHGRQDFSVS